MYSRPILTGLLALLICGVALAQDEKPERPRGAPLDAPNEDESIPSGSPLGEPILGEDGQPQQIRVIPESSLKLLEETEASALDSEDLYDFKKTKDGKFFKVTFAALGNYPYEVPDPDVIRQSDDPTKPPVEQIPDELKALNKKNIVLIGFMVPIDVDRKGRIKSFALTQNQMFCCFGVPPAMNEWVMVDMPEGKTAEYYSDLPVAVYGTMQVGEEIDEGYVISIYRMTGLEVIDVQQLIKRTQG